MIIKAILHVRSRIRGRFFAVVLGGCLGQTIGNVIAMICRNAFQAANGHRFLVDTTAAAGRLTGAVADATEDAREHVRLTVLYIGIVETTLGDVSYI